MFEAPYPPYDPTDPAGFSYTTVVHRWPVIITGVIDRLHRLSHDLCLEVDATDDEAEKASLKLHIEEAKGIIGQISKLKYEMGRNYIIQPIPSDGEPADMYNSELERLAADDKNKWFTAPWLFAECYLYRLLRSFFVQTTQWSSFDPFSSKKSDTFKQSGKAIYQIAKTMQEFEKEHAKLESDPENLGVLFKEMIQMCLWLIVLFYFAIARADVMKGKRNRIFVLLSVLGQPLKTFKDLSLLTHLSSSDIENLQIVGKEAQAAREEFILRDDQEKVWSHMKSLTNARVDFVLDNVALTVTSAAGFEVVLFTDLVLADFLVTYTPHVSTVVFHPKLIPWFVSDVTPIDFVETINGLLDPSFLPAPEGMDVEHLRNMVERWKRYVDEGIFALSVPTATPLGGGSSGALAEFWTSPAPYWDMQIHAPQLWSALKGSNLVIFKGDLNYRKLTGDVQWPAWTPFSTALGPLAGSFPLLSLRTNKADVVVGVEREIAERLDGSGSKWRVDGRYALISFLEADFE
ncbi:DUF89 domain-containing protein [Mycena rosella]|uniref:Sugar phosphate phosphatase n=1 Tax=Mycena rosella TaxID=1033263 RepID=A0AAD7CPJ0_MYCRO|nr:DUF89 domain-containing protein [Mycena rosella]